MSVGHAPNQPLWAPDMRKDDDQITEADKRDATRRIQGADGAEYSPDDSGGDDQLASSGLLPSPAAEASRTL